MQKVIVLAILQSLLLVLGQVVLKFALSKMLPFAWSRAFFTSVFLNWQFALSGLLFGSCSILWMYIIKHYPLSVAYPMISLSYAFGMLASIFFFHEEVNTTKWCGVALIMVGCVLIAK